jgi:hypothetical protein
VAVGITVLIIIISVVAAATVGVAVTEMQVG